MSELLKEDRDGAQKRSAMPSQTMVGLHPSTFEYLMPTDEQKATMSLVRNATHDYARVLETWLPNGADKTYLLRKLREIASWANIAITRHADGTPRSES